MNSDTHYMSNIVMLCMGITFIIQVIPHTSIRGFVEKDSKRLFILLCIVASLVNFISGCLMLYFHPLNILRSEYIGSYATLAITICLNSFQVLKTYKDPLECISFRSNLWYYCIMGSYCILILIMLIQTPVMNMYFIQ